MIGSRLGLARPAITFGPAHRRRRPPRAGGEQVLIGGNERYRSVCPSCYYAEEGVDPARAPGVSG